MDEENSTRVAGPTEEDRRIGRRQLAQNAITLAVQSRWEEAAEINQQIVEATPDDAEAFNRLGKAYTELGRIAEARAAYENSLTADPANLIAQRNLDRLSRISESEAAELAKKPGTKLDPRFFMEETGKTQLTSLQNAASPEILATLTAGDPVKLEQRDGHLEVTTMDETFIGNIEDRLATRLSRLIQSGNEYQAGVVGVDDQTVRIIIRETHQSPKNAGRISFPPRRSQDSLPRPYVREGLLRRSADDEDEDEPDSDSDADTDEEDEDSSEFGFHEGTLDES
jgi:hypothetical protein